MTGRRRFLQQAGALATRKSKPTASNYKVVAERLNIVGAPIKHGSNKHGSKLTPHEWFTRQPGRFVMWHVKDMHKVSRDCDDVAARSGHHKRRGSALGTLPASS